MPTVAVRVDDKLKKEATELFNSLGLDMSTAVKMFLIQSVNSRSIPFQVKAIDETRYDENGEYITDERLQEAKKMISEFDSKRAIKFDVNNPKHIASFFDDED